MRISINWIKDFVKLPEDLSDKEIANRITLSVCEVENYERPDAFFSQIIVAEIKAIQTHPHAEKLQLATLNLGKKKPEITVICAAPNCRTGIKVPYAMLGTRLPDGIILKAKKIRGISSEGMLCSEKELGISTQQDGLMELAKEAQAGATMKEILGEKNDDLILEVDNKSLTHRPDLWGHYGMAREFATVWEQPFIDRFHSPWVQTLREKIAANSQKNPPLSLEIKTDTANRGFLGLAMEGIRVKESPPWIQRRLNTAGMHPINSLVDISNYVMLETGLPNHIFDRKNISGGKIIVHRAEKAQKFMSLDGKERQLIASDTLISDAQKTLSIAGIMGGMDGSVSSETQEIMLEVANWKDSEIRQTSHHLGLRTESSQRYEKCLDSAFLEKALLRLVELVLDLHPEARTVGDIQKANIPEEKILQIETSPQRISRILGNPLDEETIQRILKALGFQVEQILGAKPGAEGRGKTLRLSVPSWRATKDIECEADIVEEIGRIIGYDTIKPISPSQETKALHLSPRKKLLRNAQDYLTLRARALEISTYPLIGEKLLKKASWSEQAPELILANPLNPMQDRMRPSLIPSLLEATANNAKEHDNFRIFEQGRSYAYRGGETFSQDLYQIAVMFYQSKENPFLPLADLIRGLLGFLGLPSQLLTSSPQKKHPLLPTDWAGIHPQEYLNIQVMGKSRGCVLSLHPQIAQIFKLKGHQALALLDITELMDRPLPERRKFTALNRFPRSEFDVTVVAPAQTHALSLVTVVRNMQLPSLRSVGILDVFPLENQARALTLRVEFRDPDKTLPPEFLKEAEGKIVEKLQEAGYPLRH